MNQEDIHMQQIEAGPDSVAIWLSGEPVRDPRSIPALVLNILIRHGLPPWPDMEAECYSGGEETLILARPRPPRLMFFFFETQEALLCALTFCPEQNISLYRLETGYLLSLPGGNIPLSFYEHGRTAPLSPLWQAHGKDQGLCLAESCSARELMRFFSTLGP